MVASFLAWMRMMNLYLIALSNGRSARESRPLHFTYLHLTPQLHCMSVWRNKGACTQERWAERLRHVAYAGGWKKFEPMWDFIIKAKRASSMLPVLESVLAAFGQRSPQSMDNQTSSDEHVAQIVSVHQ